MHGVTLAEMNEDELLARQNELERRIQRLARLGASSEVILQLQALLDQVLLQRAERVMLLMTSPGEDPVVIETDPSLRPAVSQNEEMASAPSRPHPSRRPAPLAVPRRSDRPAAVPPRSEDT